MRIFLVGFMGGGKSTVGKKLANRLDLESVDTDLIIEELFKTSIHEYFKFLGEEKFRKTERKTLEEVIKHDNIVVSTGGGLPCFNNNMDLMNQYGITIYLKLLPASLHYRLLHSKKKRPLLENMNTEDLRYFIEKKLTEREVFYNQAMIIYPGENININNFIQEIQKLL